ncbi:MAG: hypoxanthine-guanine phosphoribosyltransferase [Gammaproteobacteria bacterium]|nr:hypoxanthine-guanine phosphoribosyltransferase [Gammaproteobacteria bacterium]
MSETDANPLLSEALDVRRRARRLMSPDDVAATFERMGREITAKLFDANPVVLAVMHGGAFTAVELCRHFDFPYEFAYVHATRYGSELAGGDLGWLVEPKPQLAGRAILLVDDILDEGVTLSALHAALARVGAGSVWTAVFAVKALTKPVERPRADFVGTTVENVYVFGCGMDYKGYWRGLPELLAVRSE